jgi:hypothetical protein
MVRLHARGVVETFQLSEGGVESDFGSFTFWQAARQTENREAAAESHPQHQSHLCIQ